MILDLPDGLATLHTKAEFWSAIVGAIVGGAVAIIGQAIVIMDARKSRADADRRVDEALARIALIKLLRIDSDNRALRLYFSEAFAVLEHDNSAQPWSFLKPPANTFDAVMFSGEDLAIILKLDDVTFNSMAGLDANHNAILRTIDLLFRQRDLIFELVEKTAYSGGRIDIVVPPERRIMFEAQTAAVNDLIAEARKLIEQEANRSSAALDLLVRSLRAKWKLKISLKTRSSLVGDAGASA